MESSEHKTLQSSKCQEKTNTLNKGGLLLKVLNPDSNVIASRGVESETSFQIKASAQAFRIPPGGFPRET